MTGEKELQKVYHEFYNSEKARLGDGSTVETVGVRNVHSYKNEVLIE